MRSLVANQSERVMSQEIDEVFVALTRPPMFAGVTEVYAAVLLLIFVCVFVAFANILGMLLSFVVTLVLYVAGRLMSVRDSRWAEIVVCRIRFFFCTAKRESPYLRIDA